MNSPGADSSNQASPLIDILEGEGFSTQEIMDRIPSLASEDQASVIDLLKKLVAVKKRSESQEQFLPFVRDVWPAFIEGSHGLLILTRKAA